MYNMAPSNICALLFCSSLLFLVDSAIEISHDGGFSFLIAIDEDIAEDEAIIQTIQVSVCIILHSDRGSNVYHYNECVIIRHVNF